MILSDRKKEKFNELFGRWANEEDDLLYPDEIGLEGNEPADIVESAGLIDAEDKTYALRKTGRFITSANREFLPQEVIEEWDDAIKEYHLKQELAELRKRDDARTGVKSLFNVEILDDFQIAILHAMVKLKRNAGATKNHPLGFIYVNMCLSKTQRSLRTVYHLVKEGLSLDCLGIVRGVYENYITIVYANENADKMESRLRARISLGSKEYIHPKTKKGKFNYSIIRNVETNEEYPKYDSYVKMLKSSRYPEDVELFNVLYPYFSLYTHSSIKVWEDFLGEDNFYREEENTVFEVFIHSFYIVILFLDSCRSTEFVEGMLYQDLSFFITNYARILIENLQFLKGEHSNQQYKKMNDLMIRRLNTIIS